MVSTVSATGCLNCLLLMLAACVAIPALSSKVALYDDTALAKATAAAVTSGGAEDDDDARLVRRSSVGDYYRDSRWRMVMAMLFLNDYTLVLDQHYSNRPALLHINGEAPNHELLETILDHVCDLVSFHELALKVNISDDKDFYPLLSEIIKDSCKWVHYLANQTDALTLGDHVDIQNLTLSCSPEDTTILHQYCYRNKIGKIMRMRFIADFALYQRISEYHENDEPHLPATNRTMWLNTSTLTPQMVHRIHTDTIVAIIQYIIEQKLL